ncbi:MAG: ABC transporter permease [Candidatus Diapherotrites archaeon]|nr:ABC transporter permease [Candidatus Diapherotrites archaeon]
MIKLSFLNLFRRKTRTFLALLGVMIGVAAIIVLVSIVDGLFVEFNNVISQYKGLSVLEKDAVDQPFSFLEESFAIELERVSGVNLAIPEIWYIPEKIDGKTTTVGFGTVSVYGLDVSKMLAAKQAGWIVDVQKGRQLGGSDEGFVLIGQKVADDFGKFPGSKIEIDDTKFIVKGIFSGESELIESVIAMNLSDAKKLSGIPFGKVNSFTLDLDDSSKSEQVKTLIEFKYPQVVKVFSAATFSETFDSTLGQFRLLVFFVAGVSAIVAGVGIANTILMSIRDRIKEIGTLKAVGWSNSNIIRMVLFESLLLSFFGAVFGVILGFAASLLITELSGLKTLVSFELLAQVFVFAFVLGIAGGFYPAFIASKMEPVDALRTE